MPELKESIDKFSDAKSSIIKYWLSNKSVKKILESYEIDTEYFIKEYAFAILEYYVGVIKGINIIGKCPVMIKLLEYLKNKNLKSEELFILCSGFRKAMIDFSYKAGINTIEINQEIDHVFEQNFTAVLKTYNASIKDVETKLDKSLNIVDKYTIMSRTDLQGIIIYASDAFCKISGYTKDELIGQPHSIVRHPDMSSAIFEDMWSTIQNGKTWNGEVKNRRKDGSFYWVHATIEPSYDESGNLIGYDAIRQDITSKKEVMAQQDLIIEQSKSAAMGEMISMIAHQWRQPLQAVSILIQKLPITKMIEGEISDETLDQVVDDIGQQLEYMSKTIDDFRDFFRPEKEKENVKLSALVDKARDFLAYMLKADSIEFKINSIEDTNIAIHVNELVQVLINLIKNSRDAMIDNKIENRLIQINHYTKENKAIIEVVDNAGGIPEDLLDKIFDPYFSTKTNKNGTGLGLYMSRTIVEQHCKGNIAARNSSDGAIFKIMLPLT